MLVAIAVSTASFYVTSIWSWAPLFYAIGLPAHMLFQNQAFQTPSLKTVQAVLKLVLVAVFASVIGYPGRDFDGHLAGIFGNGNSLGIVMCLCLYAFFFCWPRNRVMLISGSVAVLYVVFLTSSRSALAFLVSFFVLYWASARKTTFYTAVVCLIALVSLSVVNMTALDDVLPEYVFGAKSLFSGTAGRAAIWQAALGEITVNPLGVGLGNSETVMGPLVGQSGSHSAVLKMTLEGGWLFGLSYLLLFLAMLKNARLPLTRAFLIALNVKYLFEIATPFGLSLSSALLTLPYFMESTLCRRTSNGS